jgi:hypothetical protein
MKQVSWLPLLLVSVAVAQLPDALCHTSRLITGSKVLAVRPEEQASLPSPLIFPSH